MQLDTEKQYVGKLSLLLVVRVRLSTAMLALPGSSRPQAFVHPLSPGGARADLLTKEEWFQVAARGAPSERPCAQLRACA